MNKFYLLVNIFIAFGPLLLTWNKNINYYKKLKPVFFSTLITAIIFIVWDMFATYRGDWSFNEKYITGFKIFNLPIEEILFFITVPFSCIFIYECVSFYIKEKTLNFSKSIGIILSISFFLIALLFTGKYYTFTLLIFTSIFFLTSVFINLDLLKSRNYWLTIAITFIPFIITNSILTGLPIVEYNSKAILGKRFITIPIEDFLYSFVLISFYLFFYIYFSRKKKKL